MTVKRYRPRLEIAGESYPFSMAVEAGGFVFVSGAIALDKDFNPLFDQDLAAQTESTIKVIERALAETGCKLTDIVRMGVFLKSTDQMEVFNDVCRKYFNEEPPARISVSSGFAHPDILVEIEVTAYKG